MSLYDFLSFRMLITPSVLIVVYYLGAVAMPLAAYGVFRTLLRRIRQEGEEGRSPSWNWKLRLLFLLFFLMAELAWRIFIEFFVAYFQMRDALMG